MRIPVVQCRSSEGTYSAFPRRIPLPPLRHRKGQGHRRPGKTETFPQHGPYGYHFPQLAIKYRLGKLTYEFHCNFVAAYKF